MDRWDFGRREGFCALSFSLGDELGLVPACLALLCSGGCCRVWPRLFLLEIRENCWEMQGLTSCAHPEAAVWDNLTPGCHSTEGHPGKQERDVASSEFS